MKIYNDIEKIPTGRASDKITDGCLILEGGAWRGLYTLGVLDCLMINDINIRTTVGISSGALCALGYTAGQIGWGARIDLLYRHDRNYCGLGAYKRDHGITGFSYLYGEILDKHPLDEAALMNPNRHMLAGVANMHTGKMEYFEKGKDDILRGVQASATVPYVSRPVMINNVPYLDGGCIDKIPYEWAKENMLSSKIVAIKTREWSYRRKEKPNKIAGVMYKDYPEFLSAMNKANVRFNRMTDELAERNSKGEIYVIAPSEKVEVSRFEGDLDKLGDLYWRGYYDTERQIDAIKLYLSDSSDS